MKVLLLLVAFGVCVALSEAANNVLGLCVSQDQCDEDECCLKYTALINRCTKRKSEGALCQVRQLKVPLLNEVFIGSCPCKDDMTCVGRKKRIGGKIIGKCEAEGNDLQTTTEVNEVTEPPVVEPDETEPPVVEPDETEPPVVEPDETEPPVVEPDETEPPVVEPDETEPPVVVPDETEPPVVVPDETDAPAE